MDTQIALDEIEPPGTPQPASPEVSMPFRSPGAVSEMSGTTAISSFSMVEAEFLEPRFIVKHLRKLCDSAQEFLEHIAPSSATMHDDLLNIQEMQKPGSAYSEEYLDYDIEVNAIQVGSIHFTALSVRWSPSGAVTCDSPMVYSLL